MVVDSVVGRVLRKPGVELALEGLVHLKLSIAPVGVHCSIWLVRAVASPNLGGILFLLQGHVSQMTEILLGRLLFIHNHLAYPECWIDPSLVIMPNHILHDITQRLALWLPCLGLPVLHRFLALHQISSLPSLFGLRVAGLVVRAIVVSLDYYFLDWILIFILKPSHFAALGGS